MAAQCRSPRCTAERKGFRRELDSWRHRLIHCVGFESILEGLYGPGLRKDLSLFDDCEPEDLVDWCVDEKCSLCNLRKDTNDYTPSSGSAQSTPTGELISQGQFNTEKTECQAENYLNALFLKKDLPQNCDPNIPLVAQELMKKMIRQFAIEYVSKSRKMYQDSNGKIADNPFGCNGIQKNHSLLLDEQDGPLDLTVTRIEEQTFQDGVLDLSVKRNGQTFEENSKTRNTKNGVTNGYFLRKVKKSSQLLKEKTALFKVLTSWCLYHQQQLLAILKFLREELESCSQTCHSNAQSKSAEQASRRPDTLLATCQIRTNQKPTENIKVNERTQQINLPNLTVRLKDIRFTCPNLNVGTVKLNRKEKDIHLSDQLLHCINTRSKKKKPSVGYGYLTSHHSTSQRKLHFSSSLSKLKVERTVTDLKNTMVKNDSECKCSQPGCQLEMPSKCCQTIGNTSDGNHMTVINNVTFKESCANEKQNRLKHNRKHTRNNSLDSSTSSCVHFGSLITHFLTSETNSFTELLNKKENGLKKNVRTGFRKNNKMSIFDSSLSDCQTIDFARKLNNLTDTFPKEKNNFVKSSPSFIDDKITVSVEKLAHDVLVLKDYESTKTESEVQGKITDLPHDTLNISSKTVNCIKNTQLSLPANLKHSPPQMIVNEKRREKKRHTDQDVQVESTIPPKRYSRNILGKCKLCDVSHGLCSFQDRNNLFCKCTIKRNSGILKNLKTEGVKFKNTTEKNRNTHLKVVVQRLEDSRLGKDVCKSPKTNLCNVKASSYVPQKNLNNVKQSDCLNSTSMAQTKCAIVEETHGSVSETAIPTTSSDNSYFSPIKLMFVSKVESEDGVKYTLSSEYTPVNTHGNVELSDIVVKTSPTWNTESSQSRFFMDVTPPSSPECNMFAQNSPAKLYCTDQKRFERKISRRKTRACQVSENIDSPVESQHKNCLEKTFSKAASDIAIFSNKTDRSNKPSSSKMWKSRIAETYVVQKKGSGTRLRIKKVERFLRSSKRNLHICESEPLNFQRISKRLEKLRALSNVSGMKRTNDSFSQEEGQALLPPFQETITKYTEKEVSDEAEQDENQKTIMEQKWNPGSLRIRKLKCSNYNTRSRKLLVTSFSSVPSSNFSVRSALCHKSKKLHLSKCKLYKRRLRSYEKQCKLPLIDTKCTRNIDENCTANIDFQPKTVLKWWSASTSKESLLQDLEKKYEQIANTWLGENNGEKDNEVKSLSALKFCSSEMRSPVQMLFQKKCDTGNLAAWFMQTTETQSLSIGRKDNAQNPLPKINRKETTTKAKKSSINSSRYQKDFIKCAWPTSSKNLTDMLNASKISKGKCKVVQGPNNLQSETDQNQDFFVKFACPGEHEDVTKASTSKASAKKITQSANTDVKRTTPNSIMHMNSLSSSQKTKMQDKSKSNPKNIYMCCSSKENIRDCKVFLTKLGDVESKMVQQYRGSYSGNTNAENKSKFKPERELKKGFTTKYCFQMNQSLARSPCTLSRIKNSTSKECNFGMCLRKSKGLAAPYDGHSKSSILERRKQPSKMTLYVETNSERSKRQIAKMGKIQSEHPKVQLGPIKPVGIPAIRGLSSKGASYSLTPIRIPLQ